MIVYVLTIPPFPIMACYLIPYSPQTATKEGVDENRISKQKWLQDGGQDQAYFIPEDSKCPGKDLIHSRCSEMLIEWVSQCWLFQAGELDNCLRSLHPSCTHTHTYIHLPTFTSHKPFWHGGRKLPGGLRDPGIHQSGDRSLLLCVFLSFFFSWLLSVPWSWGSN